MTMTIRLATTNDARSIADIYGQVIEDTAISFELVPPSLAEMRSRIVAIQKQFPWLVAEVDGRIAGYVYAGTHNPRAAYQWSADLTAYIHSDFRGRGIGKRLYGVLIELLRMQGYYVAFAGITLPNAASVALHESFGFKPLGVYHNAGYKFGSWHDVGWWELALQPLCDHPLPPKSVSEVQNSPEFKAILERV